VNDYNYSRDLKGFIFLVCVLEGLRMIPKSGAPLILSKD